MNETTSNNELAGLNSFLNLGSDKMPIDEHVQWIGEGIVDAKFMVEMVDLAPGEEILLGLDLNEEPI